MTIEASLVMPIVLVALITLIGLGFRAHDILLGNLITNEVVELMSHQPEDSERDLDRYGMERLGHTISGMSYELRLEEYKDGSRAELITEDSERTLTDSGSRPERWMRKMTLLEDISE